MADVPYSTPLPQVTAQQLTPTALDGVQLALQALIGPLPTGVTNATYRAGRWPMMSGDRWGPGWTGSHGN